MFGGGICCKCSILQFSFSFVSLRIKVSQKEVEDLDGDRPESKVLCAFFSGIFSKWIICRESTSSGFNFRENCIYDFQLRTVSYFFFNFKIVYLPSEAFLGKVH